MNTAICEDHKDFGRAASAWCREKIAAYGARSIFVPAGKTPVALYEAWTAEEPGYLSGKRLLQVDDVLTGPEAGVFKRFFQEHLPKHGKQIEFITNADGHADLAILGLGLNGHVAFHEPEMHRSFYGGCVRLSDVTCDHLKMERGTWGISYGVQAFARAKAVLFMVSGSSKRSVLERLLDRDPSLPATALLGHADVTLIADRDAMPTRVSGSVHSFSEFDSNGSRNGKSSDGRVA